MREIVNINVGGCGNKIGAKFTEKLCEEHSVNLSDGRYCGKDEKNEKCCINVFFNEYNFDKNNKSSIHSPVISNDLSKENKFADNSNVESGDGNIRYIPRSICVDLQEGSLDFLKASKIGKLFSPDNFVSAHSPASNNWAKGYYTEGAEIVDNVMDIINKEVERCDLLQGFIINHSIGGGTGSGLGSLLLHKINDEYAQRIVNHVSIFPSPNVSETVLETYNAIFSLNGLTEYGSACEVIDNEALYRIANKKLKIKQPNYQDINQLIAGVMSGITSSMRFSGELNSDLRKLCVNLVPFPRLHFFISSLAPLVSVETSAYTISDRNGLNIFELTNSMFNKSSFFSSTCPNNKSPNLFSECDKNSLSSSHYYHGGKFLAACAIYQGKLSTKEVDESLERILKAEGDNFVSFIPNNFKSSICNKTPIGTKVRSTFIANTTAMHVPLQLLCKKFTYMYSRRAFMHTYLSEGMDEEEFSNSLNNAYDLVNEYMQLSEEGGQDKLDKIAHNQFSTRSDYKTAKKTYFYNINNSNRNSFMHNINKFHSHYDRDSIKSLNSTIKTNDNFCSTNDNISIISNTSDCSI